jgi:hypothetical protein
MANASNRTTVIVAIIGLISAVTVAIIANWKESPPGSVKVAPQEPPQHPPNPAPEEKLFIDDHNPRVMYNDGGGWHTPADYNNLENTQNYTYNPGSTATLIFKGDWIEVVYYRTLGGALMRITIDDLEKPDIDTGNDEGQTVYGQVTRFDHLGQGQHTIVVTHSGRHVEGRPRSPVAGGNEPNGYYINLDGFYISKNQN